MLCLVDCKDLLAQVSSDSLDLIKNPSLFGPGFTDLFGKKFKKSFIKEFKFSKELHSFVSHPRYHGNANKKKPFRFQPGKARASTPNHGARGTKTAGVVFSPPEEKQLNTIQKNKI